MHISIVDLRDENVVDCAIKYAWKLESCNEEEENSISKIEPLCRRLKLLKHRAWVSIE